MDQDTLKYVSCPHRSPLDVMLNLPVLISCPALMSPIRKTRLFSIQLMAVPSSSRGRYSSPQSTTKFTTIISTSSSHV